MIFNTFCPYDPYLTLKYPVVTAGSHAMTHMKLSHSDFPQTK